MRQLAALLAVGCVGGAGLAAGADAPPTYHARVSRILQAHCQECHRPGQVAPFALLTYDQARKRADDLARVVGEKVMPPWHPSTAEGVALRDPRVLPADDVATLVAWAEAGAPEGNPADAPPAREFPADWPLGPPDLVLQPAEAYPLAASGDDEFRVFVLPTGLTEGRWIQAVDFRPGSRAVVHHILAAYETKGRARKLDAADAAPGYATFGGYRLWPEGELDGWAPGKAPHRLGDGMARYLPPNADLLLQVHYHKTGKPERDATAVGLYFSKVPVAKQLRATGVLPPSSGVLSFTPKLAIPPGAADHEVRGTQTIGSDIHVVAVIPHMHWLGKDFRLTATMPDGKQTTLIRIDRWDFNWQGTYDLAEPLALPKGTRLDMVAHFDNSASNPSNPSKPPVLVKWGEQTADEMCIGFLHYTRDREHLDDKPPARSLDPLADWRP